MEHSLPSQAAHSLLGVAACVTSGTLEQCLVMKGKLMSSAGDEIAVEKQIEMGFLMVFVTILRRSYCIKLTGRKQSLSTRPSHPAAV